MLERGITKMRNLADVIENFIVGELFTGDRNFILVQRNELAQKLECAPSQISYALSTRFTPERGFQVESRRGTGGFIRIIRIQEAKPQEAKTIEAMTAHDMVRHLSQNALISPREEELMNYTLELLNGHVSENDKKAVVKEAYSRVSLRHNQQRR